MAKTEPENKTKTEIIPEINISIEDTSNIKLLQKVISSINQLLDEEVTLKFTPSEILIRNMDKSRFVMVDLKIKSTFFKNFTIDKELLMTIDLNRFHSILNCYRKTDNSINIIFDTPNQTLIFDLINDISRNYTIPLIQPDDTSDPSNMPDPTNMKFDCKITFYLNQITNTFSDLKSLKTSINITANKNAIIFTNSENKNQNKITIPHEHLKEISDIQTEMSSLYSQDTFKNIIDLDPLFESNTLQFSTDHPLLLQFSNDDLSINYLIAPERPETDEEQKKRIESEEEDEDWEDEEPEEKPEEKPEEEPKEKPEEEYPNLAKCSMPEIEKLADTNLKLLKIKANEQLDLDIKHQARKTTTITSIKNSLFPEEKEEE